MESSEGYGSGREVGASTYNPSPQPKSTLHQVPCSATTAKARVVLKGKTLTPRQPTPPFYGRYQRSSRAQGPFGRRVNQRAAGTLWASAYEGKTQRSQLVLVLLLLL